MNYYPVPRQCLKELIFALVQYMTDCRASDQSGPQWERILILMSTCYIRNKWDGINKPSSDHVKQFGTCLHIPTLFNIPNIHVLKYTCIYSIIVFETYWCTQRPESPVVDRIFLFRLTHYTVSPIVTVLFMVADILWVPNRWSCGVPFVVPVPRLRWWIVVHTTHANPIPTGLCIARKKATVSKPVNLTQILSENVGLHD